MKKKIIKNSILSDSQILVDEYSNSPVSDVLAQNFFF